MSSGEQRESEPARAKAGSVAAWVWERRVRGLAVALAASVAYGIGAGLWMPRGPVSTTQALAAMVLGAGVGLVSGAALRSRWALLLAPVAFVAVYEVVRLDASGPTVDGLALSNQYGVLAFVVGRVFHGLLTLWPMLVGVAVGRAWAVRATDGSDEPPRGWRRVGHVAGKTAVVVSTAVLLVLGVALVRPAHTEAIRDADGEPLAGSIAEIATVEIGGRDQSMLIRGHDADDPVVLFLAGGPGGSEVGTMSERAGALERDFVVVTWDQRGTGRSAGDVDPDELSFEQAVEDTIEVTEHLRERFGVDQVLLVGNSYGTLLGAHAAQQRPDLYAAFIGTGQMVDVVETDQRFYDDALAHAESTGDTALAQTLRDNGPPPYDDLLKMSPIVAAEREFNDYSDIEGFPGLQEPTDHLLVGEYAVVDMARSMGALIDTYEALYPDLYEVDLRQDVTELDVPVYLVQGAHEARGRDELAREWFDQLDAPTKEWITFERSGHRPFAQEPEQFAEVMTSTVLAEVAPDVEIDGSDAVPADEADALRSLFGDYNPDVWPLHLLAYALGLAAVALIIARPGRGTDVFVAALLAALWAWLGVVFLGRYGARTDPLLSAMYGAAFVVQAALLVRSGVLRTDLRFRAAKDPVALVGWAALGYALVVYPLLGVLLGHGYPHAPLFGMAPCPTTIATFGLLLLAAPPLPPRLLVVPTVWAVLAPLAAVGHGYPEDVGLFVTAVTSWIALAVRHRSDRRATPEPSSDDDQARERVPA